MQKDTSFPGEMSSSFQKHQLNSQNTSLYSRSLCVQLFLFSPVYLKIRFLFFFISAVSLKISSFHVRQARHVLNKGFEVLTLKSRV